MSSQPVLPPSVPQRKTSPVVWILGIICIGAFVALSVLGWKLGKRTNILEMKAARVAASPANALGIGWMEHFEYEKAADAFEEATKMAPQWLPAKINLGIALYNSAGRDSDAKRKEEKFKRALKIYEEILSTDPNDVYAHYNSGIIYLAKGNTEQAQTHFEAVTRLDPKCAYAWLYLGNCRKDANESPASLECYEKALKLNPHLNAARYALAMHGIVATDEKRRKSLLEEWEKINSLQLSDWVGDPYTERGRYAEVIGKAPAPPPEVGILPLFEKKELNITLAPRTTWVSSDKLDELRRLVRDRFGASAIVLDYNRDGKPDLLLLSAVIRNGEVQDLLLRNDGEYEYKFTDVTAEAGLANHPGSLGGAAADFDNDGFVDIALAGSSGIKLFRNNLGKGFEDKTETAKFDKEPGVYLTAAWADIDQDGDLDLIAAKFAQTPELAIKQLKGEKVEGNGRLSVFLNVGVAPPVPKGQPAKPLSVAFKLATEPESLHVKGPVTGIVLTDLDGHKDIDIIALLDNRPPVAVLNDRMLRFHLGDNFTSDSGKWNGGFVLDANGDDQSDIVLVDKSTHPKIMVSKREDFGDKLEGRFAPGETDSPPLKTAMWIDLDLDGRTDIVGISSDRKAVFLQGDGKGKFIRKNLPFQEEADKHDLLSIIPININGDCKVDLLCWTETSGLKFFKSHGNGNYSSRVNLKGLRDPGHSHQLRTNADGIGSWVRLHIGPLSTAAENTTFTAGLTQSRQPIHFGIGKSTVVDAMRVRWPDAMPQAELSQPACLVTIVEINRKPDSCPTIFLWDGERLAFLTDCLGAGSMGEMEADGSTRPPRPEESVKIEPGKLVPKNGKYVLKIAEPMDEVLYLDHLRLDVIDHPVGVSLFPDERFATADPQPTQERLFFRNSERIFPLNATDHRGRDITAILRERDGKTVDDFDMRSWLGFAEDHYVELDF